MKRGRKATAAKASKAVEPVEEPAAEVAEEIPEAPDVPTTVFITGLQRPWSDDELKEKLASLGGAELASYRVNTTRSEVLATFPRLPDAERAIEGLNGKPLNDKVASAPLTLVLAQPDQDFAPAPDTSSMNVDEKPVKSETEASSTTESTSKPPQSAEDKHAELTRRGFRLTNTQPPLYYQPRHEDRVAHMRKRRNYDLDSTILPARFYSHRGPNDRRKRTHSEMESGSHDEPRRSPSHDHEARSPKPEEGNEE